MARTAEEAFAHMEEVAKAAGLTLLASGWAGSHVKYRFRCAQGHEFERRPYVLAKGSTGCAQCGQEAIRQRFLDRLAENGWVCMEGDYLGYTVRHHLECAHGHRWETEARKILEGSGCPVCAKVRMAQKNTHADGLERLRAAAAAHGGRCLADVYAGIIAKYEWECAEGHRWTAAGNSIAGSGAWCPRCARVRHGEQQRDPNGLERLQAVAASRGGELLSTRYTTRAAKYRFRCRRGHEWTTWGHLVLGGTWCWHCANLDKRRTVADMQAIAEARGGRFLSTAYLGNRIKHTWQCALGHVWETTPGTIINRGAWCPNCFRLRITRDPALRKRYDADS